MAAALCFKRPESAYIALERSCWDDWVEEERKEMTGVKGSRARYCTNSSPRMKDQREKGGLGWCRDKQPQGLGAREERELEGRIKRTAFWAAGLFCRAVPMTHNACSLMSSEGVARRPCSGSHMPSFSRSDK